MNSAPEGTPEPVSTSKPEEFHPHEEEPGLTSGL